MKDKAAAPEHSLSSVLLMQCNGNINSNGFCDTCFGPAQTSSNRCGRLIPVSSEPLEEKPFLTEDDFIARFDKFRHGIFKSSLDHWIETGKLSGSFLLEVRSLIKDNSSDELDDWKQVIIMHKDAIYELESQVSSLESELKALREERDKFNNATTALKDLP